MKKTCVITVVVSFLLAIGGYADEYRTWTSSSGKHKTEARLLEVTEDGKTVVLWKTDNKESRVPLDRLSKVDQGYIKQYQERMKVADEELIREEQERKKAKRDQEWKERQEQIAQARAEREAKKIREQKQQQDRYRQQEVQRQKQEAHFLVPMGCIGKTSKFGVWYTNMADDMALRNGGSMRNLHLYTYDRKQAYFSSYVNSVLSGRHPGFNALTQEKKIAYLYAIVQDIDSRIESNNQQKNGSARDVVDSNRNTELSTIKGMVITRMQEIRNGDKNAENIPDQGGQGVWGGAGGGMW